MEATEFKYSSWSIDGEERSCATLIASATQNDLPPPTVLLETDSSHTIPSAARREKLSAFICVRAVAMAMGKGEFTLCARTWREKRKSLTTGVAGWAARVAKVIPTIDRDDHGKPVEAHHGNEFDRTVAPSNNAIQK